MKRPKTMKDASGKKLMIDDVIEIAIRNIIASGEAIRGPH